MFEAIILFLLCKIKLVMNAVLEIDTNTVQAKQFVEYARTLPFIINIIESKTQSFEEACAACGAVSVDEFFDELRSRVKKRYQNAKS
jgi:predicted HTH domain antitoxin